MISKTQRSWCAMLAKLTSPMDPGTAAEAFLGMLPMLPDDDDAYNRNTLEEAARRDVGDTAVPNFDKISKVLGCWRRENRSVYERRGISMPIAGLIAGPVQTRTDDEIAHVDGQIDALKAELKAEKAARPDAKLTPSYFSKLQLAAYWLTINPDPAKLRPDLRKAYLEHQANQERD